MIELTNSQRSNKSKPLKTLGTLYVSYDSTIKSSLLQIRFQGERMKQMRFCSNNMNVLEIFKPKSKPQVHKEYGDKTGDFDFAACPIPESDWILIARTEVVNFNQLVIWRQLDINTNKLCYGDLNFPIKFVVKDYAMNSGSHKIVGGAVLTLNELVREFENRTFSSIKLTNQANKVTGFLKVMSFTLSKLR